MKRNLKAVLSTVAAGCMVLSLTACVSCNEDLVSQGRNRGL